MKRIPFVLALAVYTLVLAGCRPEKFETAPPAGNVITSLTGNWTLKSAIQKDETAEIKNSPYVTLDLTPLFPYTQYKLTLTGTAGSATGTYTAVPGAAPRILRSNTGKWEADNAENPKQIAFISGTDTTRMQIGSYPTSFNAAFKLRQTKIDLATGKPAITYDYEFVKQ